MGVGGARTTGSPAPLVGVGLMLLAMAILPGIDVMAKHLGSLGFPVIQIVWARLVFGGVFTLPFALRHGVVSLWPDRPWLHALRCQVMSHYLRDLIVGHQYTLPKATISCIEQTNCIKRCSASREKIYYYCALIARYACCN